MVVLETIAVGAIIYGIHRNRKYKKMKRLAQAQNQTTTTTVTSSAFYPHQKPKSPRSNAPGSIAPTPQVNTKAPPVPMQSMQSERASVGGTSVLLEPMTNFNEVNIGAPQQHQQQTLYNDLRLSNVTIKDDFGRAILGGQIGTLTLADGGFQALSVPTNGSQNLFLEGRQYYIDAIGEQGQRFNNLALFFYGVFEGGFFFSAVSPVQAQHLVK
jgi:hypothetical protein